MLHAIINLVLSGKIRKILLFVLLLMVNLALFAQTPEWEWVISAGGSGEDLGESIAIDSAGNHYITGRFEGTANFGSFSLTSSGESDIFIAKLDLEGNWEWAASAGGTGEDRGCGISTDDAGNCYIIGYYQETAYFGSYSFTSSGESDIFIAKLDLEGNWEWAASAGGNGNDRGYDISINDVGNCYVTGSFRDTATFGSHTITSFSYSDIFVARIDANGNWQWAASAGGAPGTVFGADCGFGIEVDNAHNCYITGTFGNFANFGSHTIYGIGYNDVFVAKIDAYGNWQWANWAASGTSDFGNEIIIDNAGNSYIIGRFGQTIFFGSYSLALTTSGNADIFVAKIDADGNWLWARRAGGTLLDYGSGITIDDAGFCYVTGNYKETATFGTYSLTSNGEGDIFLAKIDGDGNWLMAKKAGGINNDTGNDIIIDEVGNCYITGYFGETANFGTHSVSSNGDTDIFVAKFNYYYDITFNSLEDMITARAGFAYANDGDYLYAISGANYDLPNNRINNIEKYNPATNCWSVFADGLIPRIWGRAEYIQSTNNIYIFGGLTGNSSTHTDTMEVVDVNTGNLTYLTADHILSSQSGSAVWSNKIYIFGGNLDSGYSNELYEFDPSGNNWTQLADIPEAKETEGEIVDGILYVFGGYNGSVSNRIDAYNIQNDQWSFIGYMPTGVSAHHTTASGQYIWLFGSYSDPNFVAEFNTATHEFTELSNNMIGRRHCGTEVIGDNLYVYGGNAAGTDLSSLQYADISNLAIDDDPNIIPSPITLFQNYPNPFYPKTTISFSIKQNSEIELEIFNIEGQKIRTLINDYIQIGDHSTIWNGNDEYGKHVCSGLYFYKLSANGKTEVIKKCLLLK